MQQLQLQKLQQLQAWQHQYAKRSSVTKHAMHKLVNNSISQQRMLVLAACEGLKQPATAAGFALCRRRRTHICHSTTADAAGGDVVRPSATAATPPAIDFNATPGNGHPAAGHSSSSTLPNGSGRGTYASYSDMYKTLHSGYSQPNSETALSDTRGSHADSSKRSSNSSGSVPSLQEDAIVPGALTSAGEGNDEPSSTTHSSSGTSSVSPVATTAASNANTASVASVEDAIRKAQDAITAAETSLNSIHQLRSAQPPNKWAGLLLVLRSAVIATAAGVALVASHAFGLGWQWAGATLGAISLAARAYQRSTVTSAGAVVVAAACLATLGCSLRFGVVMLAYSYTSHKLRQFKESRQTVDFEAVRTQEQNTTRDWPEVLCIAAIPAILAAAYGAMAGCLDLPLGSLPAVETWRADLLTLLQGAVLGWYACCCGDAWSRELGELSSDQPRLLTTLQPVRKGTHGAVTLLGLSGAAAGGLLIGLLFYCAAVLSPTLWVFDIQRQAAMNQYRVIPLGLIAGVFGSLVDSLLGATLQFTGYDNKTASLSNTPGPGITRISGLEHPWINDNFVNVLAASITAVLTALAALRMFG